MRGRAPMMSYDKKRKKKHAGIHPEIIDEHGGYE
jgi:hypothetical protein